MRETDVVAIIVNDYFDKLTSEEKLQLIRQVINEITAPLSTLNQ